MSEKTKTKYTGVALFTAGLMAGAGADRVANPETPKAAHVEYLRLAKDGYAVGIAVQAGTAAVGRVVNCDARGEKPLLDGQPFEDARARALCAAAAKFNQTTSTEAEKLVDRLLEPPTVK